MSVAQPVVGAPAALGERCKKTFRRRVFQGSAPQWLTANGRGPVRDGARRRTAGAGRRAPRWAPPAASSVVKAPRTRFRGNDPAAVREGVGSDEVAGVRILRLLEGETASWSAQRPEVPSVCTDVPRTLGRQRRMVPKLVGISTGQPVGLGTSSGCGHTACVTIRC